MYINNCLKNSTFSFLIFVKKKIIQIFTKTEKKIPSTKCNEKTKEIKKQKEQNKNESKSTN